MKVLLSLPPNLVESFHEITGLPKEEFFCASDPIGHRVGSGGGTTYLIEKSGVSGKKIIIHAGGESRRLPSYSTSGKILTPMPGSGENLLTMQLPLYKEIMRKTPNGVNTLIASGDVFIRTSELLQDIPDADVICFGLETELDLATRHGVFTMSEDKPTMLDFMMQKPSMEKLVEVGKTHKWLIDIGLWVLSDRAIEMLAKRSKDEKGNIKYYDLYSDFGRCLGKYPEIDDNELNKLTVRILPLKGGEFYHFGTSKELISSTIAVFGEKNSGIHNEIWIENSFVGRKWNLSEKNIITGVPENDWDLVLKSGECLDVVPIGEKSFVARPYGFEEPFKYVDAGADDPFKVKAFPVVDDVEELGVVIKKIFAGEKLSDSYTKVSAEEILNKANLRRLFKQRRKVYGV